ncbi:hypothetical protein DL93DRAFT_2074727 [Clavulina sp. PMI_390]|nr:hypothetical protein DL93DRAFT_2074727 [Clavulina sp. PMI_390]
MNVTDVCQISANPDVSGIGMRVGIYITAFLIAVVPNFKVQHYGFTKLRKALLQAAGLNGLALLVTAVIQTILQQLDFYHSLIIMHQLTLLGMSARAGVAGEYRATTGRTIFHHISAWALGGLFAAWWLYVWSTAPSFGAGNYNSGDTSCNSTIKYVVMFVNVRALVAWIRWPAVAFGIIMALVAVAIPLFMMWWIPREQKAQEESAKRIDAITKGRGAIKPGPPDPCMRPEEFLLHASVPPSTSWLTRTTTLI